MDIRLIGTYIISTVKEHKDYLALKFANKSDYEAVKEYLQSSTGRAIDISYYLLYAAQKYRYMMLDKTTFSALDDLSIVRLHFTYRDGE